METNDTHMVFVYGTLLRGESNHRLLKNAEFVGEARTASEYDLVNLGAFPGMVSGGNTSIKGEIFSVDDGTLRALDRLEGHPRFYRRTKMEVDGFGAVEGYLFPRSRMNGYDCIESGDWRARGRPIMQITMTDGRRLSGTAKQIVEDMKLIAFGHDNDTLSDYIDWLVTQAQEFEGVSLNITGDSEDEKATSLISEMKRTGLAR